MFPFLCSGGSGGVPTTITISENTGATYSGLIATFNKEGSPTTNYNTDTTFETFSYASGDRGHGFLLPTGLASVGAGTVTNAKFRVRCSVAQCNGAVVTQTIEMYRLLQNQVQTQLTWNIYSTGNNWSTAGGLSATDADLTVLASQGLANGTANTYIEFSGANLDQYVEDVINGVNPNYGILMARNSDTAYDLAYVIWNSDTATDGQRPELVFDWV